MKAVEANIIVFDKVAKTYNQTEPHFFSENQEKVRKILQGLRKDTGGKLLDLGCGTGFIINLAKDLFDEIHGVDVSTGMLSEIDTSSAEITLHNQDASILPFEDNYFDAITSYAFIHHLDNYEIVLKEAYRVLKPDGIVYIDLEPNRRYVTHSEQYKNIEFSNYSQIAQREIKAICAIDDRVEKTYDINKDIFNASEYIRSELGGIDGDEFKKSTFALGFKGCEVIYSWYPGQGKVIHKQSFEEAEIINSYLQEMLPLSSNMFKYLRFMLRK